MMSKQRAVAAAIAFVVATPQTFAYVIESVERPSALADLEAVTDSLVGKKDSSNVEDQWKQHVKKMMESNQKKQDTVALTERVEEDSIEKNEDDSKHHDKKNEDDSKHHDRHHSRERHQHHTKKSNDMEEEKVKTSKRGKGSKSKTTSKGKSASSASSKGSNWQDGCKEMMGMLQQMVNTMKSKKKTGKPGEHMGLADVHSPFGDGDGSGHGDGHHFEEDHHVGQHFVEDHHEGQHFVEDPPTHDDAHGHDTTCDDTVHFRDAKGYVCNAWAGYDCTGNTFHPGYNILELQQIRTLCPQSCNMCSRRDRLHRGDTLVAPPLQPAAHMAPGVTNIDGHHPLDGTPINTHYQDGFEH